MSEPRFHSVLVDVEDGDADVASSVLFDLGATGIEERDGTTLSKGANGKVTLVASFDGEDEARAAQSSLPVAWHPRGDVLVGDGFRDEWKKFFVPFELCRGVVVRPPWEAYAARSGERVLELEPGRAFGTGLHETTSLVASVLEGRAAELRDRLVLDVGCGSGILSLLTLLLGASSARAVDIDPEAAEVTRENATRNGLATRVIADTTDVGALSGTYDVVLANIEARVLVPLAESIMARVRPGGLLVLSGILAADVVPQVEEVKVAYGRCALEATPRKGEWVALVYRAPA